MKYWKGVRVPIPDVSISLMRGTFKLITLPAVGDLAHTLLACTMPHLLLALQGYPLVAMKVSPSEPHHQRQ